MFVALMHVKNETGENQTFLTVICVTESCWFFSISIWQFSSFHPSDFWLVTLKRFKGPIICKLNAASISVCQGSTALKLSLKIATVILKKFPYRAKSRFLTIMCLWTVSELTMDVIL